MNYCEKFGRDLQLRFNFFLYRLYVMLISEGFILFQNLEKLDVWEYHFFNKGPADLIL